MAITIHSQPNCVNCDVTKALLDKKGVEYNLIDMVDEPEIGAAIKAEGWMQAPVVKVDLPGLKTEWDGINFEKLRQAVAAAQS
ncbi:glutaredoxin family protein [Oerskovia sp. NPDC060338]